MRTSHFPPIRFTLGALLAVGSALVGCDPDKCPGDQWEYEPEYGACAMVSEPMGGAGDGDGGPMPDAGMAMDDAVPFGAECSDDSDCGPGLCVNEPIVIGCTQSGCMEGEDNPGICPDDWMCLASPSTGESACVKL